MSTLSESTIEIVSATVPALEQHGEAIVARMYGRLLADAGIRAFFNMSHQTGNSPQHKALTGAILAYARHIREPQVLAATIERIAQKHVALKIEPPHYEAVGGALLAAISDVLGEAASEEVLTAWGEAYWFLANVLIDREKDLYQDQAEAPGGWSGWRKFVIAEKHEETAEITSFILRPEDGAPVLRHKPGQYLSFLIDTGDADTGPVRRTYSISSAPNGSTYRITVKREAQGKVSGWLHNVAQQGTILDVGAPAGEFFLDPAQKSEIVLLSGGVGLTPMISMLEANGDGALPITYVHAARSRAHHAMKEVSSRLATNTANFYEEPDGEQISDEAASITGRVDTSWLAANTSPKTADYYVCGPSGFMKATISGLRSLGVSDDRLHYEFFGPASEAL
ncbi:NO-inducible flavohemoprotein [Granulosicoccus antarcticus]|uniref:Flavohemoprotein n=1 Tax=Granulosicoccus antarcticus IMCC3135 TaxID=1192854 RepID=A0A2Z2NQR0_9GAMM|nr:NO-inducible flavohemoprotein [Granulosicoccus antarcticus]ASJ73816.1 Flavohemoprotein [Granulosicoccus antarcticus IMCC3135]